MASTESPASPVYAARARLAHATRFKGRTAPETIEARRALAAALLEKRIREIVADAPPLTSEQRDRIVRALRVRPASPGRLVEDSSLSPSFRKGSNNELPNQPAAEVAG